MIETVAYLGPKGTFTHEATQSLFPGTQTELESLPTIPDVLTSVDRGIFDLGVVPVENAIEGSVTTTLDWLVHHVDLPIIGELVYPITQALMVHPQNLHLHRERFTHILSHPQAIAQCQANLKKQYPQAEWVFMDSTAQAAEQVREHPKEPWLAVAAKQAAQNNQLQVIQEEIQDHSNNVTRFIVVGKQPRSWEWKPSQQKTSLQITLPSDYPGALYQVLAAFSWRKINLNHIESRPTKTGLGNYYFLIDAVSPHDHILMKSAMEEIEALDCNVRILGSYPCFDFHYSHEQDTIERK